MTFEFRAQAREYDYAAEQEILLRFVSGRKGKRRMSVLATLFVIGVCLVLFAIEKRMTESIMQLFLLGFLFFGSQWFWYEFTCGHIRSLLKVLYRGRHPNMQTGDRILGLRLEDNTFQVFNDDGVVSSWDCHNLYSVQESDEIFDLSFGRFYRKYLAIPKSAIVTGTIEEFRIYIGSKITSGKTVEYYRVSSKLQEKLKAAKKDIFGLRD